VDAPALQSTRPLDHRDDMAMWMHVVVPPALNTERTHDVRADVRASAMAAASATAARLGTLVGDANLPIVPTGFPPQHAATRRNATSSAAAHHAKPLCHNGFR
jgi:hypothetical protein